MRIQFLSSINLEGTGYINIRNTYLIPLVGTKIAQEKAKFWTMSELLLKYAKNFHQNNNCTYITFSKDEFYKTLISEIHLFQVKRLHLHKNLNVANLSSNWEFVTLYYEFFFTSFIFLLFLHRGFVFINDTIAQTIESVLNQLSNNVCKFSKGNYFFFEDPSATTSDLVTICFCKSGDNTHEALWKKLPETIKNELLCKANNIEKSVYENLKEAVKIYGDAFPSQTRNHFNYTAQSAYNDIQKNISFVYKHSSDHIKDFLKLSFSKSDDWAQKARIVQYYYKILNKLTDLLYNEYVTRGNENNDFHKYYQSISHTF